MRLTSPSLLLSLAVSLPANALAQDVVPRRTFLEPAARTDVGLSWNGARIGWLGLHEGRRQIFVTPIDDPEAGACLTADGGSEVLDWRFARTKEHVLFTRRVTDDGEDVHLFAVRLEDGGIADMTPDAIGDLRIAGDDVHWPQYVALEGLPMGRGEGELEPGLWLYEFLTREGHRMCDGGYERYVFDANLWPAGASGDPGGTAVIARMLDQGRWEVVRSVEGDPYGVVSATYNGTELFYVANGADGRSALFALDTNSLEETVLAEDRLADVVAVGFQAHPKSGAPQCASSHYIRLRRHVVDEELAADYELLTLSIPGELAFAGRTVRDRKWLVRGLDGGPATYWLYDRDALSARRLFSEQPTLDTIVLAKRQPFVVPSREGSALPCDLYLPPGTDTDANGRPEEPLPTIVCVRDSASGLDSWSTNHDLQLLASRGYAVIRADALGAPSASAVVDVALWAAEVGIADRERLGVWSGWSGGDATLGAVEGYPGVFACAVALDPTLGESTPRANLSASLLLVSTGHRAEQERAQVDRFAAAAAEAGTSATCLVYGSPAPANQFSFWAVAERFFAEHLGGMFEAYGDDLNDPGLEVVSGTEHVPGLDDAR